MAATVYRTTTGSQVRLGPVLGEGGEGFVHHVEGNGDLAAKIYKPGLAADRAGKVVAMVDARLHASGKFIAYPVDALHDIKSGAFAGFTMRKASGHKEVHELYSPSSRKTAFPNATFPLLVRTMANVARAMATVHASGCVIGDVNHSVVMVAPDATITFIDSDSFQYHANGKTFACKVGTPDFTPPELQGKSFAGVTRTVNHDAFGLATLVFMTLFMGRFPFVGRYTGLGEMPPIERLIADHRFAYSSRAGSFHMSPPPLTPTLADLPLPLADAFERAFGPMGAGPTGRPTPPDWVGILDRAETDLVKCPQSDAHHHFRQAPSCPWCRMEQGSPGFLAFVPSIAPVFAGGAAVNLATLIAAVRAVPDPGPAPDLATLMPARPDIRPGQAAIDANRARWTRRVFAVLLVAGAIALFNVPKAVPLFGLALLAGAAYLAFGTPEGVETVRRLAAKAQTDWETARKAFEQTAGNGAFARLRQDAERMIQQLQALPGREAQEIAALEAKRRDLQMRRHLERFKIDAGRISGIGEARKLTLRSYGIETAADIEYGRITNIRGFGPSIASKLVAWRRIAEGKFTFDPTRAVDPQDVAAVRAQIAKSRTDLVGKLQRSVSLLQNAGNAARASRSRIDPGHAAAYVAFLQAEADKKAVGVA